MKDLLIVLFVVFLVFGCSSTGKESSGDDNDFEVGDESDSEIDAESNDEAGKIINGEYFKQEVIWFGCKMDEVYDRQGMAECADITIPMDWENEDSKTLSLRLKRNSVEIPSVQLFMLQGGPGGSSTIAFGAGDVPTISSIDSSIEMIMIDQRGTGYSSFLNCSAMNDSRLQPYEVEGCIKELKESGIELEFFSTEQSANDVELVMNLLKKETVPQFVYGVSYGSTLAHEHARAFPDTASGYVVTGLNFEGTMTLANYDKKMSDMVKRLFERCNNDVVCSEKIKMEVVEFVEQTASKVKSGELCPESFLETPLQGFTAYLPYVGHEIATRIPDVFPAFYYRLARCSENDVAVIRYLINKVTSRSSSIPAEYFNHIFAYNIKLSELIGSGYLPSKAELNEDWEISLASARQDIGVYDMAQVWPRYEKSEHWGKWASTDIPFLMIAGTLDFQTQIEDSRVFGKNLNGKYQYFIEIPDGGHGLSKTAVKTEGEAPCGFQLLVDFIHNPLSEPDKKCVEDVIPLDFSRSDFYTEYYLGTGDMWED
jgi:pimeloyl-ACP methyl ester carboxylesterase